MWVVLLVRTLLSILSIVRRAYGGYVVSLAVGLILAVVGFLFIAWCLAVIGEARGSRKVCGVVLGRCFFDVALGLAALIHIGILVGSFAGGVVAAGIGASWLIMWVAIFAVAWIATWEPEEPASYV